MLTRLRKRTIHLGSFLVRALIIALYQNANREEMPVRNCEILLRYKIANAGDLFQHDFGAPKTGIPIPQLFTIPKTHFCVL